MTVADFFDYIEADPLFCEMHLLHELTDALTEIRIGQ
jgi:hypothetical protein